LYNVIVDDFKEVKNSQKLYLYIRDDMKMAVKFAKDGQSDTNDSFTERYDRDPDGNGDIDKDEWFYLVYSFELDSNLADTSVTFFINNVARATSGTGPDWNNTWTD
jgi:hypothetical protein